MRHPGVAIVVAVSIALVPLPVEGAAKPKAGRICTKVGVSKAGLVCTTSGSRLVWKVRPTRPRATPSSTPTPTPTPTPTLDPTRGREGDPCAPRDEWIIGYSGANRLVYLSCAPDGTRRPQFGAPEIDQATGKPIKGALGLMQQSTRYEAPPSVTSTPLTAITAVSALAPVQQCKITDAGVAGAIPNNPQRHFVSGFPMYPERARLTQTPVIQFIAVDFSDLPGQRSPREDYRTTVEFLQSYWTRMSTPEIRLDIRVPERYVRLPKTVIDYDLAADFFTTGRPPTGTWDYVRAAIKEVDGSIDFSDVDVIAVVPPAEVKRSQIAGFTAESAEPGGGVPTAERRMMNILVAAGPVGSEASELLNWAHELGHSFGLTDVRNVVNVSRQDSSDLGVFDLMNSSIAPELLAWQRFILGILNDDQVRCVTSAEPTTHWIRPVAMRTLGTKMVVIPTGAYTAIAVESRRSYGYDTNLGTRNEGPIVYTIDTRIPYRYSTMKIVPSPTATDALWRRDAALQVGESVTVQGWQITHLETGDFGDVVGVRRVP